MSPTSGVVTRHEREREHQHEEHDILRHYIDKSAIVNSSTNSINGSTNNIATRNSTHNTTHNITHNTTRFVGKHAKDGRLAIFLQRRNINERQSTQAHESGVDEMLGLVRMSNDVLGALRTNTNYEIRVGVMARLLCDYGLQFSEHFAYQHEVTLCASNASHEGSPVIEVVAEGGCLGDAVLPDAAHRGFRMRLPRNLPPSVIFMSTSNPQSGLLSGLGPLVEAAPWGLTWYVYAYVSQPTSADWGVSGGRRKTSKVFLSFTRSLQAEPQWMLDTCAPVAASARVSKTLLSTKTVVLDAALERSFFHMDDAIAIHVRLSNPKAAGVTSVRVTMKQLISFKHGADARQSIKVPLGVWEFSRVDRNGKFVCDTDGGCDQLPLKAFPFLVDTVRVMLRPNGALANAAIESRLPRAALTTLLLSPSFVHTCDESGVSSAAMRDFSISYYLNVHVVVAWGTDLIAKLPFHVIGRGVVSGDAVQEQGQEQGQELIGADEPDPGEMHNGMSVPSMPAPVAHAFIAPESSERDALADAVLEISEVAVAHDLQKAAVQLDVYRGSSVVQGKGKDAPHVDFAVARKSIVREFVDAYEQLWLHCEALKTLRGDVAVVPGLDAALVATGATLIGDTLATRLVEGVLFGTLVPVYRKLARLHCRGGDDWDRVDSLMEALDAFFDALELVFAQLGDVSAYDIGAVCAMIDQRLIGHELCRLGLVIPGMVEWRWLIEGVASWAVQLGAAHTDYVLSSGLSSVREGHDVSGASLRLAQTFQRLHDQLIVEFSDCTVNVADLFAYGCDLAVVLASMQDALCLARCLWIQYEYWTVALLLYYGGYPRWLLPFDGVLCWASDAVSVAVAGRADPSSVRALRAHLCVLREALIACMAESL